MFNEQDNTTNKPVSEEQELLTKVQNHLKNADGRRSFFTDYDSELIQLRDAIAEAREEDIPPLIEHMARLQALAAQRGQGEDIPIDSASPYFGHLRLVEECGVRDVLLGKRTYLSKDSSVRIVDWRNAPVSRMYYCYEEGDDYEEEFGGKVRRGEIGARRSVTITNGELRRVSSVDGVYLKRRGEWIRMEGDGPRLEGGQGSAIRAEGMAAIRGRLGVDADGTDRKDKHLPEISALLDKKQFELITTEDEGLIIIQGEAGSGKTTVGLHRMAYLTYNNPKRFKPGNMLIIVFNKALAAYVSGVLPALGVKGVKVTTFQSWAFDLRKRQVPELPTTYSEWTPSVVTRLKKHPAMLSILEDLVDEQEEEITSILENAVKDTPQGNRLMEAWRTLKRIPLEARRQRMLKWINGEARIGGDSCEKLNTRTEFAAVSALEKLAAKTSDIVSDWADLLTDRKRLGEVFGFHAPAEFTDGELDDVHDWCVRMYSKIDARSEEGDSVDEEDSPCLDVEDDALLLRLYQLKKGWLKGARGKLEYDHLMVDETQDFSALEVRIMMDTVGYRRPVTLAGDTAQRIVRESGFDNWSDFLADLNVADVRVEPLKIAYRSTAEVMEVAREVLGPFAREQSKATRSGAPVEVHQFSDPGQAVEFIGSALRELSAREPLANVAVIARHQSQARIYYDGLAKSEVPRLELITEQDFSFAPGVEVTDVRQVKGLEFDYVVLVEVNADSYPDSEESRHLLHVGATRAAHQLWMVTTGKPSPILPGRLLGDD